MLDLVVDANARVQRKCVPKWLIFFMNSFLLECDADMKIILIEFVQKYYFSEEMYSQIVDFLHKPLFNQYC